MTGTTIGGTSQDAICTPRPAAERAHLHLSVVTAWRQSTILDRIPFVERIMSEITASLKIFLPPADLFIKIQIASTAVFPALQSEVTDTATSMPR